MYQQKAVGWRQYFGFINLPESEEFELGSPLRLSNRLIYVTLIPMGKIILFFKFSVPERPLGTN